jgi:hypothetical protein
MVASLAARSSGTASPAQVLECRVIAEYPHPSSISGMWQFLMGPAMAAVIDIDRQLSPGVSSLVEGNSRPEELAGEGLHCRSAIYESLDQTCRDVLERKLRTDVVTFGQDVRSEHRRALQLFAGPSVVDGRVYGMCWNPRSCAGFQAFLPTVVNSDASRRGVHTLALILDNGPTLAARQLERWLAKEIRV